MSGEKEPRGTIGPIVARQSIVVCVGAGGVGKTTMAASIAVRAARSGRKVVCLTIDPARRLADSLGVSSASGGEQVRDITPMLGREVYPGGQLSFGMLDTKATFAEIVRLRASSPEAAERILSNKLYRYVSGSLSGMQEYMALEQLAALRGEPEDKLIVLDTPPTANAIDFFTAPGRMMEALDGRLVRLMRSAYLGASRGRFDLWGRWAGTVLKSLSRFTGTELLREIMGFVDALSDLFGSFSERAAAVEEVLRGDEVAFVLVTTPDKATLREARDFRNRLSGLGLAVDAVVFNRAHWPRAEEVPDRVRGDAAEQLVELGSRWNAAHDEERARVDRVRRAWEGLESVVRIPLLPEGASRIESLDRIGKYL